jgi:hypothetical protein
MFSRANILILGFDDRRFFWTTVIIITCILPFLLFEAPIQTLREYPIPTMINCFVFTVIYFGLYRTLTIVVRRRLPAPGAYMKRVGILVATTPFIIPVIGIIVGVALDLILESLDIGSHRELSFTRVNLISFLLTLLVITIYEAAYFFKKYMESQVEKERLEVLHAESRLTNLRNQINPHFLFNSLNILMGLIASDSEMAMDYLGKLSKFYRYTVGHREDQLVPVTEELSNAQLFGELLKVRFEDGLEFVWPDVMISEEKTTIPLSLQLLIENAVKHNICSQSAPLHVKIYLDSQYLIVENNLQLKLTPVESSGMGLENIKERFSFFTQTPVVVEKSDNTFRVKLPLI